MVTILEASQKSGITKQKVRYWIDLLEIPITKQDRKFYIPASSISLLVAMKESIYSGLSPSLSAKEVLSTYATPEVSHELDNPVQQDKRLESLEQAIMLLVESNKKLSDNNKQLTEDTLYLKSQNKTILNKLNSLSINLLPTRQTLAFKAWQPPIKQPVKVSFIKKLWLELFNPESLRSTS